MDPNLKAALDLLNELYDGAVGYASERGDLDPYWRPDVLARAERLTAQLRYQLHNPNEENPNR